MKKISEEIKKVFESAASFKILFAIGTVLVAFLIFYAGVTVGFHRASFGEAWEEHYNENFGMGVANQFPNGINVVNRIGMMNAFPNTHGATGKILKIELPNIIVQDRDNSEKTILMSDDTKIELGRAEVAQSDLKVDDFIVTIGSPDDNGAIEAKFIRVIPDPQFLIK